MEPGAIEVVGRLRLRFEGTVDAETIESFVLAEWGRYADARIRAYIPILVERRVRDALLDHRTVAPLDGLLLAGS